MYYTLKQLRYFVTAAECGNLTQASERLFVSQPAISAAITKLEQVLATQLIIRHHAKGVTLTTSGKKLIAEAKSLLAHAEKFQCISRESSNPISGLLNIGCFVSMAPIFLPSLIKKFNQSYPLVEFGIVSHDVKSLQSQLLEGDIELAISYDLNLSEQLEKEELWRSKPYVLVSAEHPLAKQKEVSIRQLKNEPMVLFERPFSGDYFYSMYISHGFKPNVRYRVNSFELVRCLVGSNHGYSILNQRPRTKECYDGSKLAYLPINDVSQYLSVVITKAKDARLTNRALLFWEFCKLELPKLLAH